MTTPLQKDTVAAGLRFPRTSFAIVAAVLAGVTLWGANRSEGTERPAHPVGISDVEPSPEASPIQALGVRSLIRAIPFRLQNAYTHDYRADQPDVSEGWLLVLSVSPDLVQPTNQFQPVLYAGLPEGPQTVERLNQGHLDGVSIAFLPAHLGETPSLAGVPIWFGGPELPERLTDAMIAAEAARIANLSVYTVTESALRETQSDGGIIQLKDRTQLEETAAELILLHAPAERSLAEGILID